MITEKTIQKVIVHGLLLLIGLILYAAAIPQLSKLLVENWGNIRESLQ
jgi:hypothetical protein